MMDLSNNHDEIEWGKKLELFIIQKNFTDPKKIMHFASFVRWTGVSSENLDTETLENTYQLWVEEEGAGRKQYVMYSVQLAEA